jgi:hypothetical protein
MSPMLWAALVPACCVVGWLLARRPVREAFEDLNLDRARDQFRLQREGLEARFLTAVGRLDPVEKLRWDDAEWRNEVVWARDRRTRRILALVGVSFEPESFTLEYTEPPARHATALFEYRKGKWVAEGRRIDEIRPHEAFIGNQRIEPISLPQPRA